MENLLLNKSLHIKKPVAKLSYMPFLPAGQKTKIPEVHSVKTAAYREPTFGQLVPILYVCVCLYCMFVFTCTVCLCFPVLNVHGGRKDERLGRRG